MLCDDCKKNKATKVYKEASQDKMIEMHLCDECAEKRGIIVKKNQLPIEILKNMLKSDAFDDATLICPKCLLSFAEFRRFQRFGCAECVRAFRSRIVPIIMSIHGVQQHIGRIPKKEKRGIVGEIIRLKTELKEALQHENYERAAELRDLLKKYGENVDQSP